MRKEYFINELRGHKLTNAIAVTSIVAIGGYALLGPPGQGERQLTHTGQPDIERDIPATVLSSDVIPGRGSRLVLRQCVSHDGCEEEVYKSAYPDASYIYDKGDRIEIDEVIPPLRFVKDR